MKKIFLIHIFLVFIIGRIVSQQPWIPQVSGLQNYDWELLFEDNFDNFNDIEWKKDQHGGIWYIENNCHHPDYITVEDGVLQIKADWTSQYRNCPNSDEYRHGFGGKIRTTRYYKDNIYVEIKCKFRQQWLGIRFDFWTYGNNPWSEIDVFENVDTWMRERRWWDPFGANHSYWNTNVHFQNNNYIRFEKVESNPISPNSWYTIGLFWNNDNIYWVKQGDEFRYHYNQSGDLSKMDVIMNLDVMPSWLLGEGTALWDIDYIRIYKINTHEIYDLNNYNVNNSFHANNVLGKQITMRSSDNITTVPSFCSEFKDYKGGVGWLNLIADDKIILKPGFKVEHGAEFIAKINDNQTKNIRINDIQNKSNNQEIINNDIKIYPNPVNDKFTIECKNNINKIEIYSSSGALLYKSRPNMAKVVINSRFFEKGIYLVKIYTSNLIHTKKIIRY